MVVALLVLGGLGVAGWFSSRRPPAVPPVGQAPVVGTAPDAAVVVALAPPPPNGAPPLPTDIEVKEPVGWDAGEAIDVALEVFDDRGHFAGATLVLKNPPCLPDGGSVAGAVEVEARTNVMGFARVQLVPGWWEVESFRSVPQKFEVGAGATSFVLRTAPPVGALLSGRVVDAQRRAVEGATVGPPALLGVVRGDAFDALPKQLAIPHSGAGTPIATTDAQGKFSFRTAAASLPLMAKKGDQVSEPIFANAASMELVLQSIGWVRFQHDCVGPLFARLGANDVVVGKELQHPAGPLRAELRCLARSGLAAATVDAVLPPNVHDTVIPAWRPLGGAKIRAVTSDGTPASGMRVTGHDDTGAKATAVTDSDGRAELVPDRLSAFGVKLRLEVAAPWRLEAASSAPVGGDVVPLVVVPPGQ